MKQTIQPRIPGLNPDELRNLLHFTPEVLADFSSRKPSVFTAARLWSIENNRRLAIHRRRSYLSL